MFLAEGGVGVFEGEDVVIGSAGEVGDDHAVLDAFLEVDVLVEGDVGPEVHELNLAVGGADAVDASEALNDAHGVPVDVVVDQVVAILEVLALADHVGSDEHVQLARFLGHRKATLFRVRREQRHDLLEVEAYSQGRLRAMAASRDDSCIKADVGECGSEFPVEVVGGVSERGEDEYLAVTLVDRVLSLVHNQLLELAEFEIMLGRDLAHLAEEFPQGLTIVPQVALPGLDVEVIEVDLDLLTEGQRLDVRVVLAVDIEV